MDLIMELCMGPEPTFFLSCRDCPDDPKILAVLVGLFELQPPSDRQLRSEHYYAATVLLDKHNLADLDRAELLLYKVALASPYDWMVKGPSCEAAGNIVTALELSLGQQEYATRLKEMRKRYYRHARDVYYNYDFDLPFPDPAELYPPEFDTRESAHAAVLGESDTSSDKSDIADGVPVLQLPIRGAVDPNVSVPEKETKRTHRPNLPASKRLREANRQFSDHSASLHLKKKQSKADVRTLFKQD